MIETFVVQDGTVMVLACDGVGVRPENTYEKQLRSDLTTAQARIAELEGELMLERAVCICGCDNSDHEFLGPDDGECCGNEDHMCLRVAPGIRAMYVDERDRADTLQSQVERLTEALEKDACNDKNYPSLKLCAESYEWMAEKVEEQIADDLPNFCTSAVKQLRQIAAALTPDGKGG